MGNGGLQGARLKKFAPSPLPHNISNGPTPMTEFFPLRVDPSSKSYPIQRSKQEFMQANIKLFSEKWKGAFIRAGGLIRINRVRF